MRLLLTFFLLCVLNGAVEAQLAPASKKDAKQEEKDTGKEKIGKIKAVLYIGTNEDVKNLGQSIEKSAVVTPANIAKFQKIEPMRFKHYRKLGEDVQAVFRSYENWLSPLKPSEEILLSFESRGFSKGGGLRLDLQLWQHRRKIMKSDPVLYSGKSLFILGPQWRGGTLIIAVNLMKLNNHQPSK